MISPIFSSDTADIIQFEIKYYTRVFRTVVLCSDESAKLSAVVNAVAQLCDAQNADTERQLTRMLEVDDMSGLVKYHLEQ